MSNLQNPVLLAKIGAPHGVRGQVRVTSYTDDQVAFAHYGPLFGSDGHRFLVTHARAAKNVVIASFKQITTREEAEKLRGVELFIERDLLPQNTDEDEFYIGDLIGMEVIDIQGQVIGKILALPNFGAGDLLEISPRLESGTFGANSWLLAFTKTNVPDIDMDKRQVTVIQPREISERDIEPVEGQDHQQGGRQDEG
jgi:16S rRNA processing protein RimM